MIFSLHENGFLILKHRKDWVGSLRVRVRAGVVLPPEIFEDKFVMTSSWFWLAHELWVFNHITRSLPRVRHAGIVNRVRGLFL